MELLQYAATNRSEAAFASDFSSAAERMQETIDGKIVLIVGAAGTIAGSTINQLIPFKPQELILVDINENGLTEVIRYLRNCWDREQLPKLTPILLDITSNHFVAWLETRREVSIILNFSAVKHVRSERDAYSLLRMFEVNVLASLQLTQVVSALTSECRLFSVSTDKAANPVNFMGASKRLMEAVLFRNTEHQATSARFANVAFSQGSLLEGWLKRIELGQPIPVPSKTKRFFVSMQEAGQLCAMAAFAIPNRSVAIPNFSVEQDLQSLEEVAGRVLRVLDLQPKYVSDERQARVLASGTEADSRSQIVLLTPLNTEGEKPFEEFVGDGDQIQDLEFQEVRCLFPAEINNSTLNDFLDWLKKQSTKPDRSFSKAMIREAVSHVLPNANWSIANAQLDDRV